eukprot:scaffold39963_cov54-Phaeocystis_antarctica.AAC.3
MPTRISLRSPRGLFHAPRGLLCNGGGNSAAEIFPNLVGLKPRSRCSNQSFGRGASSYPDRPTNL